MSPLSSNCVYVPELKGGASQFSRTFLAPGTLCTSSPSTEGSGLVMSPMSAMAQSASASTNTAPSPVQSTIIFPSPLTDRRPASG
ncbi:hypothetical protein GUJ93_ZPchr0001g33021 [Zizania palustris]|uniref:Uncharacterized protein n=1 Tax=Zizania palustris TaxID=103762 RepID=A0A8J5R8W9_ZIZPA|nr:hypothetical protein GUJ93_ZPchr0001g31617 [Zizania palustris]KAG8054125.1 hypothetical protein GUJ93_ZPchr0001g33021 [Zizania palustris]